MKYTVDTTDVNRHIISISLEFVSPWNNPILQLPVWTPGSYKIRDYSRYIRNFEVSVGQDQRSSKKITKSAWEVTTNKGESVIVNYEVYAYEFSVRTSYLSDRYALLSPASLFFYLKNSDGDDNKLNQIEIQLIIPEKWSAFNSMQMKDELYIADNFDDLVDSPFAIAHPKANDNLKYTIQNTNGDEIPCEIVIVGLKGNHRIDVFRDAMINLQEHSKKMFGELPYNRYLWVLYVVDKGTGGLEHRFNNFSVINRWYFDKENKMNYARILSLEAHEHFHAYNIKRVRPTQLGPFDYTQEVYTTLLWVAEGMTSYYDNVILPRANLIDQTTYWDIIAKDYTSLQKIPGRFHTSIADSSFDAWIKHYQPHEGSNNLYVSYYLKGGIVTFMLDLEIREQTNWEKSLDDFFRLMWEDYKSTMDGYDEENLKKLIESATETDLTGFWKKYITGTETLPFNKYLNLLGMTLREKSREDPYLGWKLSPEKSEIIGVDENSPAMNAGLSTGDRIISINKFEVSSTSLGTILSNYKTKNVKVHFFRDGKLRTTKIDLKSSRVSEYQIVELTEVNEKQKSKKKVFFQ